jgi:hypothetical protein
VIQNVVDMAVEVSFIVRINGFVLERSVNDVERDCHTFFVALALEEERERVKDSLPALAVGDIMTTKTTTRRMRTKRKVAMKQSMKVVEGIGKDEV